MTAAVSTVSAAIVAISGVWFCSQVLAVVDRAANPLVPVVSPVTAGSQYQAR